jgi:NAD+ kinase
MKIAVHGHTFKPEARPYIQYLFDELLARHAELQVYYAYEQFTKKQGILKPSCASYTSGHDLFDADFIFSVGGDGTLLEAVAINGAKGIPILGINAGTLGFLATTPKDKINEAIEAVFEGFYQYDERTIIRLVSDKPFFGDTGFGLNEFSILKRDTSSMIIAHTYINGEYLNSYWADGLIVSTPTGSTGYSLSVGGPLVLPHSNNFIISPVSPHNLNVRPMVVADNSVISFEIEGRHKKFLISLDSRSRVVDAKCQLAVCKADFKVKLVKLNGYNFLETLRSKLGWGHDTRK